MTKLSFTIETVDLAAQSTAFTADPHSFSAIALEGIFTYGVRRWFQDYINSQAHAFKLAKADAEAKGEVFNGGKPFDVKACFEARLEQAITGEIKSRGESGPSFTPEQDAAYEIVAHAASRKAQPSLAKAWTACKGMTSPERKLAMLEALSALPTPIAAAINKRASEVVAENAKLLALLS